MTLQMLRCFVAVAESHNFAQAADQLFLSQPAVTHQIQSLESELGVSLLDRTERPAKLTPCGVSFYNDAKDILSRLSMAVDRVKDSSPFRETLSVGCQSTIQLTSLGDIYRLYSASHPEIYINNIELMVTNRGNMLADTLDVAFLTRDCAEQQKNIRYHTLYRGKFCCVVPENHRLAGASSVSADDFSGEILILLDTMHCPPQIDAIQTDLRRNCSGVRFSLSSSSLYTVYMTAAGLGIAVMPDFVCPPLPHIQMIPFETDRIPEFGIAAHGEKGPPRVETFIQIAREVYLSQ